MVSHFQGWFESYCRTRDDEKKKVLTRKLINSQKRWEITQYFEASHIKRSLTFNFTFTATHWRPLFTNKNETKFIFQFSPTSCNFIFQFSLTLNYQTSTDDFTNFFPRFLIDLLVWLARTCEIIFEPYVFSFFNFLLKSTSFCKEIAYFSSHHHIDHVLTVVVSTFLKANK